MKNEGLGVIYQSITLRIKEEIPDVTLKMNLPIKITALAYTPRIISGVILYTQLKSINLKQIYK